MTTKAVTTKAVTTQTADQLAAEIAEFERHIIPGAEGMLKRFYTHVVGLRAELAALEAQAAKEAQTQS